MMLKRETNEVGGTKMGREDEVRLIAYSIWEQEGCYDGHDMEHWLKAEAIWEKKQKPVQKTDSKKSEAQAKKSKTARKKT
jgi:hypothetical protein